MDKYTIDLDKVLNDFEYSELTEQNNVYATNASNASSVNQSYGAASEKTQKVYGYDKSLPYEAQNYPKAPVKHSINNVFHSLNEYLNSDIKTSFETPSSSISEVSEIETDIPIYTPKTEVASVQEIFKRIGSSEKIDGNAASSLQHSTASEGHSFIEPLKTSFNSTYLQNNASNMPTYPQLKISDIETIPYFDTKPVYTSLAVDKVNSSSSDFPPPYLDIIDQPLNDNLMENVTTYPNTSINYFNVHHKDSETECAGQTTSSLNNSVSNLPSREIAVSSVDNDLPSVEIELPGAENNLSAVEIILPCAEVILPSTDISLPSAEISLVTSTETSHPNTEIYTDAKPNLLTTEPCPSFTMSTNTENNLSNTKPCLPSTKTNRAVTEANLIDVDLPSTETNILDMSNLPTSDIISGGLNYSDVGILSQRNLTNIDQGTGDLTLDDSQLNIYINLQKAVDNSEVESPLTTSINEGFNASVHSAEDNTVCPEANIPISDENTNEHTIGTNDNLHRETIDNADEIQLATSDNDDPALNLASSEISQSNTEIITTDSNPQILNTEATTSSDLNITPISSDKNKSISLINEICFEKNENKNIFKTGVEKYEEKKLIEEKLNEKVCNIEKAIGFEDSVEISDTEMENELAQLEEEYNERISKETKAKDVGNDVVNDKNDSGQTNTHTETEMEEINENKIKANKTENIKEDTDVVEEVTLKEDVQMMETSNDKKKHSLLRPNSLDLNSESSTENPTRNVIGNPGSTPYPFGIVYVESAVDSEENTTSIEVNDTENDVTNSLSPTISEVSTSEASDSPNTSDSCNDTSLDDNLNDSQNVDGADVETKNNEENSRNPDNLRNAGSSQTPDAGEENEASGTWLGKTAPFWTPDSDALSCLHCNTKFTVIKRRHHCRACGLVLCSKCCNMKYKLEYMDNAEARVCVKCYEILTKEPVQATASSGSENSADSQTGSPVVTQTRVLNPGNPMDYCSVVPPLQQVSNLPVTPPSVMVPVGVLKRKGSGKARSAKSVMFCDGIRPGCDLTELDYDFNYKDSSSSRKSPPVMSKPNRNIPKLDSKTNSFIPSEDNSLPPTVNVVKSEISYSECANNQSVVEMLKNEALMFAIQRNLHITLKIINMDCCINKLAWCFCTEGMISVGQDEIVILLEFIDNEKVVPKDVFLHLNNIYRDAVKGTSITETGLSIHPNSLFLESKNHAGFLYVKPTFQCLQNVLIPKEPYLVGILIHRWETPWAKIFPLRLLLRLGAEYRYYPSPIISTRHRESVYVEIGHTIINLLADFRNFSYTLPNVRGLTIHMEEKNTTVSIPVNRYDQVMKALNNSSDHILAFAANFSPKADSHLVCIQDTHGNNENAYTTHAINIHNKPRKVTGASFIVLNGALKSSSGLTAKSSIVEDGLMIQILPEQMVKLRTNLRNMKDFKINCGCVNAESDEFVNIVWTENDVNFNVGVVSPIDNMSLSGVPSIRVHNGRDYMCNSGNKMIRWTEVFIIQSGDENVRTQDPVDISKLSENISKATCQALVKYLDLLATNSFIKIGIRTTLHIENVSYMAGSNGVKLPPIYMKSLDNELVPILHKITTNNLGENAIVTELIFHILNV